METDEIRNEILLKARELGFDLAAVAPALLPAHYRDTFRRWLQDGLHGNMDYLARRLRDDRNAETVVPGARSVIMLAINYFHPDEGKGQGTRGGQISRYAVTRDYHKVIEARLKAFSRFIETNWQAATRYYVDTGPVLERAYAEVSGLGYIGRNSCLITKPFGSWVFLAAIVTDLELPPDQKNLTIRCGTCRRCIDACPTRAIREDHTIDARRCISYLTIENREGIPEELRDGIGNWLFGCDICQEVCPHNARAVPARLDDFQQVRIGDRTLDLRDILAIADHERMVAVFAGTPIMRAKRRGLLRNACVVAGNSGDPELIPHLQALHDREEDPMLREHARWAIDKLEKH